MKTGFQILIVVLLLLTSCVTEETSSSQPMSEKTISIELIERDGDAVNEIDVLAFKVDPIDNTKEYFDYRSSAQSISNGADPTKKEIVIPLFAGGGIRYRFVFLANSRERIDALGEISSSTLKEDLLNILIESEPAKWSNTGAFPMWGETPQMYLSSGVSRLQNVNMIRMLARVDVAIDPVVFDLFKLKSIRVYNYNSGGAIIPSSDSGIWNGTTILKPTIPIGVEAIFGPLIYDQMTVPDVSISKQIYLFEAKAATANSKATCLIVGGVYNNSGVETYYRLDLADKNSDGVVSSYWDIVRNYLYNIKITSIGGPGYATPEEAFRSQSIQMDADITAWENGGLSDANISGNYLFRVNKGTFTLPMNQRTRADRDNKLVIFTDNPEGWRLEKIVDETGDFIPASWLTLSRYSGEANNELTIDLLTDENNTEIDRVAYVHLVAGRLEYVVEVVQTTIPELELFVLDSFGEEINNLIFSSGIGSNISTQKIDVVWAPKSANISVNSITLVGIDAFDFGSGDVIDYGTVTGVDGLKSYNINPAVMTQAEINADPFKEKALRFDFTVTNGVSYQSKALFLQQKNFNAVPTVTTDYHMNGSECFFTIKANAPWEIEVTDDPHNIVQTLITSIGGQYEDKREERVYFNIINNLDPTLFDAQATFTIRSTNVNRPFPDKTVTIKGYSIVPRKRLLTIGSSQDIYGYNFAGTAASNKLITTARNFGTLSNSYVKFEGFTIINGGVNPSETQLRDWLVTNPVDLVILGFDNASISTAIASLYAQYLNNGGCVLAFQDRTDAVVSLNFLKAVLNNNSITATYATGAGSVYRFIDEDIPVLNGPFGNIRGLQWGEDASTTVRVYGIAPTTIYALSGDRDFSTNGTVANAGYVTGFVHKTLNLVWFGDGGFNSNNGGTDLTICPFKIDGSNFPIAKPAYGRGVVRYPVYNSVFTANAIAWAIKKPPIRQR